MLAQNGIRVEFIRFNADGLFVEGMSRKVRSKEPLRAIVHLNCQNIKNTQFGVCPCAYRDHRTRLPIQQGENESITDLIGIPGKIGSSASLTFPLQHDSFVANTLIK